MEMSDEAAAAATEMQNSDATVTDTHIREAMECQEAQVTAPTERDRELTQLKVCDQVLKGVKEMEVRLVAEVAKHWRIGDGKRKSIEEVAGEATQSVMKHVALLKETLVAKGKERERSEAARFLDV
ncbi:hypothetical protein Q1695_007997 [Nippostrongylus brasiliensis]|nr:hypothetical protein Q1695_007997 [Nippostrongylus brasiliensis]